MILFVVDGRGLFDCENEERRRLDERGSSFSSLGRLSLIVVRIGILLISIVCICSDDVGWE
jgi:hypothetical protein